MTNSFTEEAAKCRAQANEFAGRPEQPFLLRLSKAFEDLAERTPGPPWARSTEDYLVTRP